MTTLKTTLTWCLWLAVCLAPLRGASAQEVADAYRGQTAAHWIGLLSSTDKEQRRQAAYALGQIGAPAGPPAVAALVRALNDSEVDVIWYAEDALGRMGPTAGTAVPALVSAIRDPANQDYPYSSIRVYAASALGRIGKAAESAAALLREGASSRDLEYRVAAMTALWRINADPAALSKLLDDLKGPDSAAAFAACMALAEIGQATPAVETALVSVMGSIDSDLRRAAARALGNFGVSAVEPVIQGARQIDRETLLNALGFIADNVRETVLYKKSATELEVQESVDRMLRPTESPLHRFLVFPDEKLRRRAVTVLAKLGPVGIHSALRAAAQTDSPLMRQSVAECLAEAERYLPPPGLASAALERIKRDAFPLLWQGLRHSDPAFRSAALRAFAVLEIGGYGRPALPLLRDAIRDDNVNNRRNAKKAIEHLQTRAESES